MIPIRCCILFIAQLGFCAVAVAQEDAARSSQWYEHVDIGGVWFIGYQYADLPSGSANAFFLRRGYLDFRINVSEKLSVRSTPDITVDSEGPDAGNVELRMKYLYLKAEMEDLGFFTNPFFEIGMVHRPWIDFEQQINPYRVQGTMFLERYNITNSADLGVTFMTLLGGEMDEEYQERVNHKYAGKYGSLAVGVYNGPGYHDPELNNNKIIEGRISLRPLPNAAPGFQASYNVVWGKGNLPSQPDFTINSFFMSYEQEWGALTAQYYTGLGNSAGTYVDAAGEAFRNRGYSLFGELFAPETDFAFFARYDYFLSEQEIDLENRRIIAGLSYYFLDDNKIVLNVDALQPQGTDSYSDRIFEIVMDINF